MHACCWEPVNVHASCAYTWWPQNRGLKFATYVKREACKRHKSQVMHTMLILVFNFIISAPSRELVSQSFAFWNLICTCLPFICSPKMAWTTSRIRNAFAVNFIWILIICGWGFKLCRFYYESLLASKRESTTINVMSLNSSVSLQQKLEHLTLTWMNWMIWIRSPRWLATIPSSTITFCAPRIS